MNLPSIGANPEPVRWLDLRLVPAALTAWAVTAVGIWVGWLAAAAGALAGVLLVLAGCAVLLRHGDDRWPARTVPRRLAAGLLAAGAAAIAAGALTAVAVRYSDDHPVRHAADSAAAATVLVRLTADPRPIRRSGYGGGPGGVAQLLITADLRSASIGGRNWTGAGQMVLLTPVEGWAGLLPGQEVRATGQLSQPWRRDLTVGSLRVRGPPMQVGPPPWWQRAAGSLRTGLRDAAGEVLPARPAGLLPSLVVGDTGQLDPAVRDEFRASGLAHLTAVSGLHVTVVCGAVLGLLRLAPVGPRTSAVLTSAALIGFVVLARPSPNVLRAAVMGGIGLLALLLGRQRSAMPALAVAVLGLLLFDPAFGVHPGFAMSVLATASLVVLAPRWAAALRDRRVPRGLAEALAVPAAAHLATAPIVAGLSGQVSLVAVVANLLATPAVVPAMVLGVLAAALTPVHDGAAQAVVWLAGWPVRWLLNVGHQAAGVPGAAVGWPSGPRGALLLVAATVVVCCLLRLRRLRVALVAGGLGVLLVLVPTRVVTPGWPAGQWALVACDVGQGDALVLAAGGAGRAVVVDTGPEPVAVDRCLRRLGVRQVPMVVLSHLHADHVGGLAGVLDGRSVGAVAIGPLDQPAWAFRRVRALTEQAGVPLLRLNRGHRLSWPRLTVEVIAPRRAPPPASGTGDDEEADDGTPVNNASLVLRADTAVGRVLLTGDVELAAQAELLDAGIDLRADVLKVPHHGSRYSQPAFLAAVRPRAAVVSAGAGNGYGHPNPGVLDALTGAGVRVLRTDQHGDIAIAGSPDRSTVTTRGGQRVALTG